MRRASCLAILVALLVLSGSAAAQDENARLRIDTRRVSISLGFAGQEVFLWGQTPPATRQVVVVIESPSTGPVRLMEKGRVALFWMGVRQYAVADLPGLYLVSLSCPDGNALSDCNTPLDLAAVNRDLASVGARVGPGALVARAKVEVLKGDGGAADVDRLLEGFWELQASRGLYEVFENRIRINREGTYYFSATLPTAAPEGKYTVTAYFLGGGGVVAMEAAGMFVRKAGMVAWLSRFAERSTVLYGAVTVFVALAAGWLAGAMFKRGASH